MSRHAGEPGLRWMERQWSQETSAAGSCKACCERTTRVCTACSCKSYQPTLELANQWGKPPLSHSAQMSAAA